jgi:transaldolase/glucose-6-phosphate isomerase
MGDDMSKIRELSKLGQSIWYDYIRRSFLTSGELQEWIDKGLRGVTSNPSIFEKAIAGSADYDYDLKRLVNENTSVEQIYEILALEDIAMAAKLLQPVYDSTHGIDGYISLEVSPTLAHDTENTISEAKRLFEALHRPNVMIKVPATSAGIPAVEELIGSGVNVNVTLIFDIENYRNVAEAYLKGLEKLAANGPSVASGQTVHTVSSVASFFVSRVDTAVDAELEKINEGAMSPSPQQGKAAVANAKIATLEFQKIFAGPRWEHLAGKGARVQRLLWASTGTKNPLYSDTLYVDELIGPDTVNTVPPATLNSFLDHGNVDITLTKRVDEARTQLDKLADSGIDLDSITQKLQVDGVNAFAKSFESLMASISEKRDRLLAEKKSYSASLGKFQATVDHALMQMRDENIMNRIWQHDHSVWKPDPAEISNRLGWLHSPEVMMDAIPELTDFVDDVRSAGYTQALLLGMGGSSLAPEVFRHTFGVREGHLNLAVLDGTDPGAVLEHAEKIDPAKTLFIVSTKSGGTVETLSFMKYFYNHVLNAVGPEKTGEHFIAITDPRSELEAMARELKFRKIFLNDPNIGGRYSALSYFGLVPAALIGMDLAILLERAATMACNCEGCNCTVAGDNSGAWLGAILGQLAKSGRDKLTFIASPHISHFGAWAEQLIAESTGKDGKGIVPVDGEALTEHATYANDRLFVYLRLEDDNTHDARVKALTDAGLPVVQLNLRDLYDLGAEFFRWEMATAVAGMHLGINPFDQPNVESAKVLARTMVSSYQEEGELPVLSPSFEVNGIKVYSNLQADNLGQVLKGFLALAEPGENEGMGRSYIALQAYIKPSQEADTALQDFRSRIQSQYRMATTVGYGPRFLHSTGQLHKGDSGHGLFIQFTADMPEDTAIPDQPGMETSSITFGVLKTAQALGDRQALLDAGRNVIRFDLGKDVPGGLRQLAEALS